MNLRKRLCPPRLFAVVSALSLPFLTGCCTGSLIGDRPREEFRGIRGAYLTRDELGIVYTTAGNRRHDQIARFELRDLRRGPEKLPYVVGPENRPMWDNPETRFLYPERVDLASGSPPEGARQLPVGHGTPALPPGATIAVFAPPEGMGAKEREDIAIVLVVSENGQVYKLRPPLPCPRYKPCLDYPLLPIGVALDVATLPLQFLFFLMLWASHP